MGDQAVRGDVPSRRIATGAFLAFEQFGLEETRL
jgi:hypothetical protein